MSRSDNGRSRRRAVWIGVIALATVWLVVAAAQVALAANDARGALGELDDLRGTASDDVQTLVASIGGPTDDLPEESTGPVLESATASFESAERRLGSVVVAPLRAVPWLGRQLRSTQALSGAAAEVTSAGAVAFEAMTIEGERVSQTPEDRLGAARRTRAVLDDLGVALSGIDLGAGESLVGPLARARTRFGDELGTLVETVDDASTALAGLDDFLTGPTRYLVLAANNAEMRAGSGMPLQVGVLDVEQGELTLSEFTPSEELLAEAAQSELDPDIDALWGWLEPNREWRNLNLSPRFDETARMAADMWAAAGGGPVDGVMAVDAVGLKFLLEITGPVEVPGEAGETVGSEVTADTVLDDLLLEQYSDFGFSRDARRDRLGRVADAVFEAFNDRSFSAADLLKVLQRSAAGRHIILWSDEPLQEAGWQALDAGGTLPEDSILLSVLNRQGNKLDQFLAVDSEISATTTGSNRRIVVRTTLTNTTPDGLPAYVVGPHPRASVAPGVYGGILTLTMPAGAGNIQVDGAPTVLAGDDGPTRVVGADVVVPRAESLEVTISFDLPTSWDAVTIQPSARVPNVNWSAGPYDWTDEQPERLDLELIS